MTNSNSRDSAGRPSVERPELLSLCARIHEHHKAGGDHDGAEAIRAEAERGGMSSHDSLLALGTALMAHRMGRDDYGALAPLVRDLGILLSDAVWDKPRPTAETREGLIRRVLEIWQRLGPDRFERVMQQWSASVPAPPLSAADIAHIEASGLGSPD